MTDNKEWHFASWSYEKSCRIWITPKGGVSYRQHFSFPALFRNLLGRTVTQLIHCNNHDTKPWVFLRICKLSFSKLWPPRLWVRLVCAVLLIAAVVKVHWTLTFHKLVFGQRVNLAQNYFEMETVSTAMLLCFRTEDFTISTTIRGWRSKAYLS